MPPFNPLVQASLYRQIRTVAGYLAVALLLAWLLAQLILTQRALQREHLTQERNQRPSIELPRPVLAAPPTITQVDW